MSNEKFIDMFDIVIGSLPYDLKNPILYFQLNDRIIHVSLTEFKKWIDTMVESKGDRSPKAYEAFNNFKGVFVELLYPFINYKNQGANNE